MVHPHTFGEQAKRKTGKAPIFGASLPRGEHISIVSFSIPPYGSSPLLWEDNR